MASQSNAPPRTQRGSDRPVSRPVEPEFVAVVRGLWVRHDPMRLVVDGEAPYDLYDHQSYVAALCADEILSVADAEQIVTNILRNEFGVVASASTDAGFSARVQALAAELFATAQRRVKRPASVPPAAR